jgi:hypothetical protein
MRRGHEGTHRCTAECPATSHPWLRRSTPARRRARSPRRSTCCRRPRTGRCRPARHRCGRADRWPAPARASCTRTSTLPRRGRARRDERSEVWCSGRWRRAGRDVPLQRRFLARAPAVSPSLVPSANIASGVHVLQQRPAPGGDTARLIPTRGAGAAARWLDWPRSALVSYPICACASVPLDPAAVLLTPSGRRRRSAAV